MQTHIHVLLVPLVQVAAAGSASCAAACQVILQPAVAAVLQDTAGLPVDQLGMVNSTADSSSSSNGSLKKCRRPVLANCGVLCVLHSSLIAVTNSLAATAATTDAYAALTALFPDIATALIRLQQLVQQQHAAVAAGDAADAAAANQLQLWLLLVWQELLGLPAAALAGMQQQQLDVATHQLLQVALHGSCIDVQLQMLLPGRPGSSSSNAQAAAAAALQRLAGMAAAADAAAASGMQALQRYAAPVLLDLLKGSSSSSSSGDADLSSRALELLQQVAGSSSAAAWQVLLWLQPLVLAQVQQADMVRRCSQCACCVPSANLFGRVT